TYSDTSAAANTTYWYAVSAYDTVNAASQQSSPVSVTVPLNTTDSLTLTPAALGQGYASYRGFVSGQYGQLSPTVLTGGMSVSAIYDSYAASIVGGAFVSVSGFSSDPGQGWLWSVNAVGITKSGSGVRTYSYSGGTATWYWSDNFGFAPGSVATVAI